MKTLNELFREVILANELENNLTAALRFSDPDGVLSGKSGWSFGVSQFDTQNNGRALDCLRECGFTDAEIKGVVAQSIDVKPLNARLAAHAGIIAEYDTNQLAYCLNKAMSFASDYGVPVDSPSGVLALADIFNQYGGIGESGAKFLKGLGHPIAVEDALAWRLQTKYGREHPSDCRRRIRNVLTVCERSVA